MRYEERDAIVAAIAFGIKRAERFEPKRVPRTDLSAVDWAEVERTLDEVPRIPRTLEGQLAQWLPLVKARKMKLSEIPAADRKLLVSLGKKTFHKP